MPLSAQVQQQVGQLGLLDHILTDWTPPVKLKPTLYHD